MDTARLKYNNEQMKGIRAIGSRLKTAFTMRAEQAQIIANYIKDSPHPVIVMGDFNDTPQSYAYRKIKKGLNDSFRKSGRGFGNTYAGELPSFRIDYIMYGPPLLSSDSLGSKQIIPTIIPSQPIYLSRRNQASNKLSISRLNTKFSPSSFNAAFWDGLKLYCS